MVIIIENGRFGNQLFQFNFCLKILKEKEKIIFIGFDDLSQFVKKNQFIFVKNNNFITRFIVKYRHFLSNKIIKKFSIMNFIIEDSNQKIIKKRGFLNMFTYVDGHFEREKFMKKNFFIYLKKNKLEDRAIKFIKSLKKNFYQKIFFIHIRLGDNLVGIDKESPSVLPLAWFFKCKRILKYQHKNSKFIYVSDDLDFLKENFKNELYINNKDQFFNFFIMKNCDGGILSPSTFSWWAAYLSKKKDFLGPKHWHGHKKRVTFPRFIESSFIKYKPVLTKEYLTPLRQENKFYKINL
jgi:hypothetical protein